MMIVFAPKESDPKETRAALNPETAKKLVDLGYEVRVEAGIGVASEHADADYEAAGATVANDRAAELGAADAVVRVNKPSAEELAKLKKGAMHVSYMDPFNEAELLKSMAASGATGVSLEMIPRTTLAQKMDVISSQANIAGYESVVVAAERLNKILPMMMTPAGTISPAKVFVLGIGVAGLQAIATAKRLGARVTAFDIRAEALEQAESLGAKALRIDLGETGSTDQGYAKELTPEQIEKQVEGQAKACADSDIVITTAKVFGRKAPVLISADVVKRMKRGSVIVDLAASESGGNVGGTVVDEEIVTENGVRIVGISSLERRSATHATQMFSANIGNFLEHYWDKEEKSFKFDLGDEILKGCVLTHDGAVVHERFVEGAG